MPHTTHVGSASTLDAAEARDDTVRKHRTRHRALTWLPRTGNHLQTLGVGPIKKYSCVLPLVMPPIPPRIGSSPDVALSARRMVA